MADTGPGMLPNVAGQAFDAFFTTKGMLGTGLGLWICREIIQRHNGRIQLRTSQRPGHAGTTFNVFLPFDATLR